MSRFDPNIAGELWHTDPQECIRLFKEGIKAGDLDAYAQGLTHLEWQARINNCQMPYHSAHMTDMYFNWYDAELIEFHDILKAKQADYPSNTGFNMLLAFCCDALGINSQEYYDAAAAKGAVIANMVHYDWTEAVPETNQLTPLVNVRDVPGHPEHITMISMDSVYALKYLKGVTETYLQHTDQGLLIHLYDCDYALIHEIKERVGFGIVAEWPEANKNYFHSIRLVRLAHLLRWYSGPKMWLMDADVLISGPMDEIFSLPEDLVWRARPGRLEPWNQINACLFGCDHQGYIDQAAGYIHRLLREDALHWGCDQMAMWAVWRQNKELTVSLLDDRQLCYDETIRNPIVMAYSGARKKLLEAA
jgi:hypothetical protein